jgi:hypothetical protein
MVKDSLKASKLKRSVLEEHRATEEQSYGRRYVSRSMPQG